MNVPPAGVPVNVLVSSSEIEAELVVLSATIHTGVTVNVTSSEDAAQDPSAAIVYLIVTCVFVFTSAGVYVFPLIVPPPETIVNVPPAGVPVNVLVSFSKILAVDVVLSADTQFVGKQLLLGTDTFTPGIDQSSIIALLLRFPF